MELKWLNLLHLFAAMVWVGGSLAIPLVITPVIRKLFPAEQRIELISAMGARFRPFGWAALLVLVLTGIRRTMIAFAGQPDPWSTSYGQGLRAKILLVVVLLIIQFVHDFVLGPRLRKLSAGPGPNLVGLRKLTIALAAGGLLLTLVIVYVAAGLRYR